MLYDEKARVESYNVSSGSAEDRTVWHNSVWHPSLPFALSALVRHPKGANNELISQTVNTILAGQLDQGQWPNTDGSAGISIWSVWPFLDSLADFLARTPIKASDTVLVPSSDTWMIRRRADKSQPLSKILASRRRRRLKALLRRHWALGPFLLVVLIGMALVLSGRLGFKEFGLALVFPLILAGAQEIMARGRGRGSG